MSLCPQQICKSGEREDVIKICDKLNCNLLSKCEIRISARTMWQMSLCPIASWWARSFWFWLCRVSTKNMTTCGWAGDRPSEGRWQSPKEPPPSAHYLYSKIYCTTFPGGSVLDLLGSSNVDTFCSSVFHHPNNVHFLRGFPLLFFTGMQDKRVEPGKSGGVYNIKICTVLKQLYQFFINMQSECNSYLS